MPTADHVGDEPGPAGLVRCADRGRYGAHGIDNYIGFRVALAGPS